MNGSYDKSASNDKGLNLSKTIGTGGGGELQILSGSAVKKRNKHWQPSHIPTNKPEERSRDKQE